MRGHRRGGRFTVHARDNDSAFVPHDGSESLGPSHRPLGGTAGCDQDGVVLLNGRGENDQLGLLRVFCAMLVIKFQTESLQAFHLERNGLVRPAHPVTKLEQERGNATHPAAGNADQVNAVVFAREKSRQIEFSLRRHAAVYRSMVSTTALAALRDESRAEFFDIRCKRRGSSMIWRNLR